MPKQARGGSYRRNQRPAASSLTSCRYRLRAEAPQHSMKPDVVRQIGLRTGEAKRLEVGVFELPGRVVLHQRHCFLRRPSARQYAGSLGKSRRPPFAQRLDVRRAALGEDVAGKMVAPHQQRHFQLDTRARMFAVDDHVIGRASFELVDADESKTVLDISEPEAAGIKQVRAKIRQDAGTTIPPSRIAHQARRAVAIERSEEHTSEL